MLPLYPTIRLARALKDWLSLLSGHMHLVLLGLGTIPTPLIPPLSSPLLRYKDWNLLSWPVRLVFLLRALLRCKHYLLLQPLVLHTRQLCLPFRLPQPVLVLPMPRLLLWISSRRSLSQRRKLGYCLALLRQKPLKSLCGMRGDIFTCGCFLGAFWVPFQCLGWLSGAFLWSFWHSNVLKKQVVITICFWVYFYRYLGPFWSPFWVHSCHVWAIFTCIVTV